MGVNNYVVFKSILKVVENVVEKNEEFLSNYILRGKGIIIILFVLIGYWFFFFYFEVNILVKEYCLILV